MPIPPIVVKREAQRGLDWRREYGRGGHPSNGRIAWAKSNLNK